MLCRRAAIELVALLCLAATDAIAAPPPAASAEAPSDERTEQARRLFKNGLMLYGDQNYQGALAEFEAAYELKPGAASLQNIALCLKGLFRYAEAADKLEVLLQRHASELEQSEKSEIRAAIDELNQLVGSIVIRVNPPEARVFVDGRSVAADERSLGIRLDVGEHALTAEAPGYDALSQVIRIAGGRTRLPVDLALKPIAGFITVLAGDPDAAIAVDGEARAFERWTGPLPPGRHYVQVYKQGYRTFEQAITVEVGQTSEVRADLGAPLGPGEQPKPAAPKGPQPESSQQRGWYALGALSATGLGEAPSQIDIDRARQTSGSSFGVRAGYRVWTPVAVEFLLEGGRHEFQGACDVTASQSLTQGCNDPNAVTLTYTLESFRLGGNLKLMSSGRRLRFVSSLGVGAVRHVLSISEKQEASKVTGCGGTECRGVDPYFLAELGAQLNLGHILTELDVLLFYDGAHGIRGNLDGSGDKAVFGEDSGGLRMLGIGLRGGWGEWKP